MTITDATSVFLADGEAQDISEDYWVSVLERAGSFEVDALWAPFDRSERPEAARQLYRLVTDARQRASYWLAKPFEEHGAGTNQNSVLWRGETRSWGNATSVRLQSLTGWSMYFDAQRGREYVRYANVIDSMKDALFRIIDPTYVYVKEDRRSVRQVAERFVGLDSPNKDKYVAGLVRRMNEYTTEDTGGGMSAQIPGFTWQPADAKHHRKGRSQAISGFAVHYTGGTNSLGWLTTDSPGSNVNGDPVSATFLIKHQPTLEDRGWQLVRIEDTPFTTGSPVNSFTVSFEYEQLKDQEIPDIAYDVMAQTILDAAEYVTAHALGNIPITREAIKGHKEWVGDNRTCPDGIEVDRIVALAQNGIVGGERLFAETGYAIRGRIRAKWESLERIGEALPVIGYPTSEEYDYIHNGETVVRQDFQRLSLIYQQAAVHPWDVSALFPEDAGRAVDRDRLDALGEHLRAALDQWKVVAA